MRRLSSPVALLALAAMASMPAAASERPVAVASQGIPHQALFDIDGRGADAVAVGAAGTVLLGREGGRDWRPVTPFTDKALLGVSMGKDAIIAVGQEGEIWRCTASQDGWQRPDSGTKERLFAVAQDGQGNAIAVGAFGTVLASSDGGASWQPASPEWSALLDGGAAFGPSLYDVLFTANGAVFAVGEWGLVIRSDDLGRSWRLLRGSSGAAVGTAIEPSLFALAVAPGGGLLTAGQEGLILHSPDGGNRWQRVDSGSHANLLSLASTADGRVVAAGMRDTLVSSDGGLHWQRFDAADFSTGWYSGAATLGDESLFLAGHSARILRIDTRSGIPEAAPKLP